MSEAELERCFRGEAIWGEALSAEELEAWHRDEREAYASMCGEAKDPDWTYPYHALNRLALFSKLPGGRFPRAFGLGSAHGEEFAPIAGRIDELDIVEPGRVFWREDVCGVPARYHAPEASGELPLPSEVFDLGLCLGVLHHVPKVGEVLSECGRVLKAGGYLLVREPIVSMGDWRRRRGALTLRERGIPRALLRQRCEAAGFEVRGEFLAGFSAWRRVWCWCRSRSVYDSRLGTWVDHGLARLFRFNEVYHPRRLGDWFRPTMCALVLRKGGQAADSAGGSFGEGGR